MAPFAQVVCNADADSIHVPNSLAKRKWVVPKCRHKCIDRVSALKSHTLQHTAHKMNGLLVLKHTKCQRCSTHAPVRVA